MTDMKIRIVFMGSPKFAMPTLRALADHYSILGVITQPDKPTGRGRVLTPPPVKLLTQELGLPVIQPTHLREPEAMAQLQAWQPDLIVVVAFGQILRPAVLDLPRYGCLNVHASLLPRWRGPAPIQAAILNGDAETGISIIRLDPGVDTGPILSQRALSILPDDTAGSLSVKLAEMGAQLFVDTLPGYLKGTILPQPQANIKPTYAPMLKKEDAQLDFNQPAELLCRRVRAFNPWPGAFTQWDGRILKVHRAHAEKGKSLIPGTRLVYQDLPAIAANRSLLVLDQVQPAGKKPMAGKVFLRGAKNWVKSN